MLNFIRAAFWKNALWGQSTIPNEFNLCNYSKLPLLAIDLELTELDTKQAKITSIAWVSGKMFDLDLSSSNYKVVRAAGDLKQSPLIHGLCAKEIAQGGHIREQMESLKQYINSHVWVFHNAALDMQMLSRIWKLLGNKPVVVTTIDTMLLHVYELEKTKGFVPKGGVTLAACRKYYRLVNVPEHNALDDAIASLTLLFAQFHHLDKTGQLRLKDLTHSRAIKTYTLG